MAKIVADKIIVDPACVANVDESECQINVTTKYAINDGPVTAIVSSLYVRNAAGIH